MLTATVQVLAILVLSVILTVGMAAIVVMAYAAVAFFTAEDSEPAEARDREGTAL